MITAANRGKRGEYEEDYEMTRMRLMCSALARVRSPRCSCLVLFSSIHLIHLFPLVLRMAFEENTLLFGSDPTPRIVAIELGETGTVKVYRREKDGSTAATSSRFIRSSGAIPT